VSAPSDDRPKTDPGSVSPENPTRTREPSSTAEVPADADGLPPPAPVLYGNPARYVVLAEHGRGGLGRVSRAHDLGLGRDVAIKELLLRGGLAEVRFLREALITARLEHPGIVPVHEAGRWPDGRPFYAMKLVSGRPLRALIAERTTIDERIGLLHHVIAVADAIAYAHDRNIIHRDLKPANVIVGDFGETIVIDWGLAKDLTSADDNAPATGSAGGTPDNELTVAGSVLGTPSYMSPEQERGEPVDQRADVFAIGAMLWELCGLEKLPPGDVRRHRLLRSAGIDDDLIAIIAKASDPDPARRYPHAGALAADLKAFKSGARITARRYSLYAALAHWTRRHRAAALAALAFVAVGIASVTALAALYRSSRSHAQAAHDRLIQSYEEQGRRLLLDGEYLHALPYLAEAYAQGDRSTAVRFLLARAERLASAQLAVHMHATRVRDATFRPDGAHILSVSDRGEAAIWDAATGEVTAVLPARTGGPYAATVSQNGTFAAIAHPDGVTVWDGARAHTIATGPAERIAIDAAGTRIAVIAGGELSAWSEAGERLWTASTKAAATHVAWIGDAVVVVGVDTIARVADGRTVVPLAASGPVYASFVSGGMIATVSGYIVELWDAAGVRLGKIVEPTRVTAVASDRSTGRIAVASADGIVRLYAGPGGTLLSDLVGHRGMVRSMEFNGDGGQLATTGADRTVRIWDVVRHRQVASLLGAQYGNDVGPTFDASSKRVVTATNQGEVRVFAATDPDAEAVAHSREGVSWVQFFDGGRRFATSGLDAIRTWTSATGALVSEFAMPSPSLAVLSPDGTKLAIINPPSPDSSQVADAEIRDAVTHGVLARFRGASRFAWAAFDHASQRIVTGSVHREVEVWNLRGERLASFHRPNPRFVNAYLRIGFSPDDRRIVGPSGEQSATIWDIASGRELGSVTLPGGVNSALFDATGSRFLTSGGDRIARLWDADTFALLRTFEFSGSVRLAVVSPSGTLVAALTTDGAVNIMDVASRALLTRFQDEELGDTAFSPDGDRLITGGDNGAVVWHLGLETRPAEVVTAFVRCRVPYRLVETRLEPATPACE
jgi:eukaryotic-like serine/threonine-protein kinase